LLVAGVATRKRVRRSVDPLADVAVTEVPVVKVAGVEAAVAEAAAGAEVLRNVKGST
jgi:hypothetical protein